MKQNAQQNMRQNSKPNIGIVDRYARLVTGILALNYAATAPKRQRVARGFIASLGAMKVAEGLIGWCPAVEVCNRLFQSDEQKSTPHAKSQGEASHLSNNQDSSLKSNPEIAADKAQDENHVSSITQHAPTSESDITQHEAF